MVKKFVSRNKGLIVLASILLLMLGQMLLVSIRAERYASAVALVLVAILFVGVFITAKKSSQKPPEGRFHPLKPWKTTFETTRMGLWIRAAFPAWGVFVVANVVAFGVRIIDGGELRYISIYSFQCFAFVSFLYWHARRQYFPIPSEDQPGDGSLLLRYSDEPRKSSRHETVAVILGTVAAMLILSSVANWLS